MHIETDTNTDRTVIYNHIISLGQCCHTSKALQRLGLKKYSCPFDWIVSNAWVALDCIDTNFSIFLDKSQYIDCNVPLADPRWIETRAGHKKYGDTMFFHRDPRIENNYQYYSRCV